MIDLNTPIWQTLSSAGNDADLWLRRLLEGEGDRRETIEILAEDLSHQLSYYSATAYVLPHLAALYPKLSQEDAVFLLAQMSSAISAEAAYPLEPDTEAHQEFHEGLAGLRPEVERLAADPGVWALLKGNMELGQNFALAALAILGDRTHAYDLCLLSSSCWQEGMAACVCGWNDENFPLVEPSKCLEPAGIGPWDRKSLTCEAVWFHGLLALAGDTMIRPIVPMVYGTGICPDCGRREPYWAWMERFMQGY